MSAEGLAVRAAVVCCPRAVCRTTGRGLVAIDDADKFSRSRIVLTGYARSGIRISPTIRCSEVAGRQLCRIKTPGSANVETERIVDSDQFRRALPVLKKQDRIAETVCGGRNRVSKEAESRVDRCIECRPVCTGAASGPDAAVIAIFQPGDGIKIGECQRCIVGFTVSS